MSKTELGCDRQWIKNNLSGSNNALWRFGKECWDAKEYARLAHELTDWWEALPENVWDCFGQGVHAQQAKGRASGAVEVHRALGHWQQGHWDAFCQHLLSAAQAYCASRALAPKLGSFQPIHSGKLPQWSQEELPEKCVDWLESQCESAADRLAAVGMVRSALAVYLADLLPPPSWHVHLPVVLIQDRGIVKELIVEMFERRGSGQCIFPNPFRLGCTTLAEGFPEAIQTAWEFAQEHLELPADCWVRWQLCELGPSESNILGGSAGAAFAACLWGLAEKLNFDRVGMSAAVSRDGSIGRVTGTTIKLDGARAAGIRRFIVAEGDPHQYLKDLENVEVIAVRTIEEAIPHLTGVVDEVLDYLRNLGRLGLSNHVLFRPDWVTQEQLTDFCLPARVLDERELDRREEIQQRRTAPQPLEDHGYLLPTSESIIRDEHEWSFPKTRGLEQVLNTGRKHVLLRGEPGEGKTTALWLRIASRCKELGNALLPKPHEPNRRVGTDSPDFRVPLILPLDFVPVRERRGNLAQVAGDYVRNLCYGTQWPQKLERWLDAKIDRGEFELYLDALDELVSSDTAIQPERGTPTRHQWLATELQLLANIPVMMTARLTADPGGLLNDPLRLRIACFGQREVTKYVHRYFHSQPKLADELHDRLRQSPGPKHLAQLPLLLAILCYRKARDPNEPLPNTRTELLKLFLHALFEWGDQKRGFTRRRRQRNLVKEQILWHVAWTFYAREPQPLVEDKVLGILDEHLARFPMDRPDSAEGLLQEYLEDGVLVPMGWDRFRFILRIFHEFSIAGYLAQQIAESPDGQWCATIRQKVYEPGWLEPISLLAGMLPESTNELVQCILGDERWCLDAVRNRQGLTIYDRYSLPPNLADFWRSMSPLFLATRCVLEQPCSSGALRSDALTNLFELWQSDIFIYGGEAGDPPVRLVIRAVDCYATYLSEVECMLSHKEEAARTSAVFVLSQLSTDARKPLLVKALDDHDENVACFAAHVIGLTRDDSLVTALRDAVKRREEEFGRFYEDYYTAHGFDQDTYSHTVMRRNTVVHFAMAVVSALADIRGPHARAYLERLAVSAADLHLRGHARKALASLEPNRVWHD